MERTTVYLTADQKRSLASAARAEPVIGSPSPRSRCSRAACQTSPSEPTSTLAVSANGDPLGGTRRRRLWSRDQQSISLATDLRSNEQCAVPGHHDAALIHDLDACGSDVRGVARWPHEFKRWWDRVAFPAGRGLFRTAHRHCHGRPPAQRARRRHPPRRGRSMVL